MEISTALKTAVVLICAVHVQNGYAARDECDVLPTIRCSRHYFQAMNTNMHRLATMRTGDIDEEMDTLLRSFPARPECFRWAEECTNATMKEFLARVESSYELAYNAVSDRSVFKALVTAYKCYDVERFTACMSKAIRDFFTLPLKDSMAGIKKYAGYLTKTTQACLVATETCPEGADAGKERALKLLLAFAQIWS